MKLFKKIQILLLCCFAAVSLHAQCPVGDIVLNSQGKIDSFPINYPGCIIISNNITIEESLPGNILNLYGLNHLDSIGGDLNILNNSALTSLVGLDTALSIGGDLKINGNVALAELIDLGGIIVHSQLEIGNNSSLNSVIEANLQAQRVYVYNNQLLAGFTIGARTSISVHIQGNPSLVSLRLNMTGTGTTVNPTARRIHVQDNTSLSNLVIDFESLFDGDIILEENDALLILDSISGLDSIGGDLKIIGNAALEDINGLGRVLVSEGVEISGNPVLQRCCKEERVESQRFHIQGNPLLMEFRGNVRSPFTVGARTARSVYIQGNPALTDLVLDIESSLDSNFILEENDALVTLDSISGLDSIGGDLKIIGNAALEDINGLGRVLVSEGVEISGNPVLQRCCKEERVESQRFHIQGNPLLMEFRGNVRSPFTVGARTARSVYIQGNPALTDLVLDIESVIDSNFVIIDNDALLNLDSISGLDTIRGDLKIKENGSLASCCGVLNIINGGVLGSIEISDNQTGCDNLSEVMNRCSDDDGDGYSEDDGDCDDTNLAIYPGATEICNGIDDDCDGQIDEDNVCCLPGCCPANMVPSGIELVNDGNFGPNSTGQWVNDYHSIPPYNWCVNGTAAVVTGASFTTLPCYDPYWHSCVGKSGDPINDYFLVVNDGGWANSPPPPPIAWKQTITVIPGKQYLFSAWVNNIINIAWGYDPIIQLQITDPTTTPPTVLASTSSVLNYLSDWEKICLSWQAPNPANATSSYILEIRNLVSDPYGNDWALDCISFQECLPACICGGGSDADGDGYCAGIGAGYDCDDNNPAIHPGATEICNGIDDNCNGLIDTADPALIDTKKPTPLCNSGLAGIIPPAPFTISGNDLDGGSFDNCGAVTLTVSQDGVNYSPTTDFFCPGFFSVYLGVTDIAGNFGFCQTAILIQDISGGGNVPPGVTCTGDLQVPLDANCQATINVFALLDGGPYGADCYYLIEIFEGPGFTNPVISNLGNVIIPSGYAEQTLIYKVTNTDSGEMCDGTIELEDNIPPTITCPADKIIAADENCQGLLDSWPPASLGDNCSNANDIIITQSESPANFTTINDVLTVTLTAEDESGNQASCNFTVTLKDLTPPVIACPADQVRNVCNNYAVSGTEFDFSFISENCLGSGFSFDWALTGATNNSGIGTTIAGAALQPGITTVQWIMTDGSGNPGTCSFNVTVNVASGIEICDGIDNDCNGQIDEGNVCCPNGIVFVKWDAAGANNGSSWANAYTDLQNALASTCPGVSQIWVAAGTYKPTSGTNRTISFVMKNNLAIYGGFNGTETLFSQRNWVSNVTILSGEIGSSGNIYDNSLHVISNFNNGLNSSAVLDGFKITEGHAVLGNTPLDNSGGGMFNMFSSPTIRNCLFTGNLGFYGGGMNNLYASPNIYDCIFSGNSSPGAGGGGIYNHYDTPNFINCNFIGNSTLGNGGGMLNYDCTTSLINCSFSGNKASSASGGIYNYNALPTLKNCIIWGNSSGVVDVNGSSPTYTNTIVQGLNLGGGVFNGSTDPLFVNQPNFNNAPTTVGDLHLQSCSPAIDAGTNNGAPVNDLDGIFRPLDGNSDGVATTDLGAYEKQGGILTVVSANIIDEACAGAADGIVTINASASCPGTLMYSIDGGSSYTASNVFSAVSPGTYNIKVIIQGYPGPFALAIVTVNPGPASQTWYRDFDNDGYSNGVTQVSCSQPTGFKLPANLTATSGDCNDNDANQFPGQTWYKDADNDGYSDGTTKVQCAKPSGYKAANQLIASSGDCADGTGKVPGVPNANMGNVHPGATEICNGIDDDCNGFIDDNVPNGMTYTGNVTFSTQAQVDAFPTCYSIIAGNVTIQGAGVTNLSNLSSITSITGTLTIQNTGLVNLTGLDNLGSIGGTLFIYFNNYLASLTGLENLNSIGFSLLVYYNFSLSFCCPIEHFLISGGVGGGISIFFNSVGCNSGVEVTNVCPLFVPPDNPNNLIIYKGGIEKESFTLFPNPTTDGHFTLHWNNSCSDNCRIEIFDLWQRKIQTATIQSGEQELSFSITDYPAGLYVIKMIDDSLSVWETRLVKQ